MHKFLLMVLNRGRGLELPHSSPMEPRNLSDYQTCLSNTLISFQKWRSSRMYLRCLSFHSKTYSYRVSRFWTLPSEILTSIAIVFQYFSKKHLKYRQISKKLFNIPVFLVLTEEIQIRYIVSLLFTPLSPPREFPRFFLSNISAELVQNNCSSTFSQYILNIVKRRRVSTLVLSLTLNIVRNIQSMHETTSGER